MRKTFLIIGVTAVLSGCAVEAGEEPLPPEPGESAETGETGEQSQALDNAPSSTDGTACCAKDYREGNGDTVVCGTRSGEWCCNAENTVCASCNYYECEPPPPKASTFKSGVFYSFGL